MNAPRFRLLIGLSLTLMPTVSSADEVPTFERDVQPFVARYCLPCHNDQEQSAELSLSPFSDSGTFVRDRKIWDKVLEQVRSGQMPPADATRPLPQESDLLVTQISAILDEIDRNAVPDPGRVTMRRLNRTEYRNTIRDLIGVRFDPTADFPSDDIGHGFDNIGDVLTLSPVLMERYLAAAETIMEQAVLPVPPPVVKRHLASVFTEPASGDVSTKLIEDGYRRVTSNGTEPIEVGPLHTPYQWEDGDYVFRTRVYVPADSPTPVKVVILLQGRNLVDTSTDQELAEIVGNVRKPAKILQTFEVQPGGREKAEVLEVSVPKTPGRDRMMVGIVKPTANQPPVTLYVESLALDGPLETRPVSHRNLLACDSALPQSEQTRMVLKRFLRRAYRRAISEDELSRSMRLVELNVAAGDSWESGVQLAMQAALCSPMFLFRVEQDSAPDNPDVRPLNDFQVASRLSYFLWSSMPDDRLLDLAEAGTLTQHLDDEVGRMLADPRAEALVQSFAMQWLQLQRLDNVAPDGALFPSFNGALRQAMIRETQLFVESIIRDDRSILDLIAADFTFLNEPLAKHYGIADTNGNLIGQPPHSPAGKPIQGDSFVRIALRDRDRGGLLTQASVLTVTSNPTRTSPVKRGRWVLEQILGSPPPGPPPNVPELPSDEADVAGGSLRSRLEVHRSNPACANCHAKMDPIGFALENFDAVGRFRTQDGEFAVDSSGELPDGTTFDGPADLKAAIVAKKREFVRCFAEKLMIFAIGRGLEYYDRPVIERICDEVAKEGYKFSAVAKAIVHSEPFRQRRALQSQP